MPEARLQKTRSAYQMDSAHGRFVYRQAFSLTPRGSLGVDGDTRGADAQAAGAKLNGLAAKEEQLGEKCQSDPCIVGSEPTESHQ